MPGFLKTSFPRKMRRVAQESIDFLYKYCCLSPGFLNENETLDCPWRIVSVNIWCPSVYTNVFLKVRFKSNSLFGNPLQYSCLENLMAWEKTRNPSCSSTRGQRLEIRFPWLSSPLIYSFLKKSKAVKTKQNKNKEKEYEVD